jgi:hypothetical protein
MKKSLTMGIVLASVVFSASAFGATQDKDQQKCINALNKGMNKIASAQLKANAKCISDFSKAKNMSASSCYASPQKVTDAMTKNTAAEAKKCTVPPTLGPTGAGSVNNYSSFNAHEMADDLLGPIPDNGVALCATSKEGCKCQAKAIKASNKLYSTSQKVFNKCKKSGLKDKTAPFDDVTDLNACLGADPKNKISKALTKLGDAITKKCPVTVTNPFPTGDCNGETGAALADCIDERVRCHVCITLLGSDDLTVDCDAYDDGNNENGSCFDDF